MAFKDLIIRLDFFGISPSFLYQSKSKFRTIFGGVFGIIIIILIITGMIYFGRELWERTLPTVNTSMQAYPNPDKILLKNLDFYLGIQNITDFSNLNDARLVNVIFYLWKLDNNEVNLIKLKTEECKPDSFKEKDLFGDHLLKNTYCLSKVQEIPDSELYISGVFMKNGFRMIYITINECVNSTNVICRPKEEIDFYLSQTYFGIKTIDYFVDTKNFSSPLSATINDLFTICSNKMYTGVNVMYRGLDIVSDVGWMFQSLETISNIKVNENQKSFALQRPENYFGDISIQLVSQKEVFKRRYLKFQEVLAQVGGFINFVKVFASLLYYLYCKSNYENFLFNSILKLESGVTSERRSKIEHGLVGITAQGQGPSQSNHLINLNMIIEKSTSTFHKIGFFSSLFGGKTCKKNFKSKMENSIYLNGIELLKEKLNVDSYFRLQIQFELMKYILLKKDDKLIFENVSSLRFPLDSELIKSLSQANVKDSIKIKSATDRIVNNLQRKESIKLIGIINNYV